MHPITSHEKQCSQIDFSNVFSEIKMNYKVRWEDIKRPGESDGLHSLIRFNGVPFMSLGLKTLLCHQGADQNVALKRRTAAEKEKVGSFFQVT
jgi:hypothetical protein